MKKITFKEFFEASDLDVGRTMADLARGDDPKGVVPRSPAQHARILALKHRENRTTKDENPSIERIDQEETRLKNRLADLHKKKLALQKRTDQENSRKGILR